MPDLSKHPFPEYLRFGIPVCLNTDDRGMFGSDLTDEYFTAVPLYHLTWPEIVALGRNSLAYGFMQPEAKLALLTDYDRRVSAFEAKYNRDDWTAALPRWMPWRTPFTPSTIPRRVPREIAAPSPGFRHFAVDKPRVIIILAALLT